MTIEPRLMTTTMMTAIEGRWDSHSDARLLLQHIAAQSAALADLQTKRDAAGAALVAVTRERDAAMRAAPNWTHAEAIAQRDALLHQVMQLRSDNKAHADRAAELQMQVSGLEECLQHEQEAREAHVQTIRDLHEKIETLQDDSKKSEERNASLQKHLDACQERIAGLEGNRKLVTP